MLFSVALSAQRMQYEIDMTQSLDTFSVMLEVKGKLTQANEVFQFASTAPGTYQTMNIGRFVTDFKAFDKQGSEIPVEKASVNQFRITRPEDLASITYRVAETWDTKVEEYPIYLMCGSSLESDHALINAHTMMGYFHGLQKSPIQIELKMREGWTAGTALKGGGNKFKADDYDHAVDSPILMGKLTYADTKVAKSKIQIYTYSANDKITSERLLESMSSMLNATKEFLIDLPVDQYTFLYHFEPTPPGITGAWEHSYSSEYALQENDFNTPEQVQSVTDIASHEFFHIVTPLNIHSEVVESFNFVEPTPSVHLWLYEGITEWASNMLLYRAGELSLQGYLDGAVKQKIIFNNYFNKEWSIEKIAQESFNTAGSRQYGNIYMRGSLFGNLLDIRLLELSEGEFGLREVLLDLIKKYGKGNPISEEDFFDDFVEMTFPEIRELFDNYILDSQPYPLADYFAKVGIEIIADSPQSVEIKKMENLTEGQQKLFDAWSKNLPRN